MPPKKASRTLASHLISSDDDDDSTSMPVGESKKQIPSRATSVESSAIKKGRGRPKKTLPSSQEPLHEEEQDQDVEPEPPKPKIKTEKTKDGVKPAAAKKKPTKPISGDEDEDDELAMELDVPPKPVVVSKTAAGKGKPVPNRKKATAQNVEIPETQFTPRGAMDSDDPDSDGLSEEEADEPPVKSKVSKSKRVPPASADVDGLAEELAQLKLKYQKLRSLKMDESDAIHQEEIQVLEDRDRASQKIIDNLKSELKSRSLSFQHLQDKDKRIQQLEQDKSGMEKKIDRLVQEHAILSAKLETARNQTKPQPSNAKTAPTASGPTKEFSHHKDNLYADLCGLIVVNVKKDEDGGIEYDCLSTGKNGALHFKLQLDAEDDDGDEDDDEPYFTYNPMLEKGRDERLINILPPIFRDEMNFRRTRGVDFYLQLLQSLQS